MKWILVYVWLSSYGWYGSMVQRNMTYDECQRLHQTIQTNIPLNKNISNSTSICVRDDSGDGM